MAILEAELTLQNISFDSILSQNSVNMTIIVSIIMNMHTIIIIFLTLFYLIPGTSASHLFYEY